MRAREGPRFTVIADDLMPEDLSLKTQLGPEGAVDDNSEVGPGTVAPAIWERPLSHTSFGADQSMSSALSSFMITRFYNGYVVLE